jgi:hypothetical protein
MAMATAAHKAGARRLDSALLDQDRLRKRFQSAVGTSSEFGAYTRLESAREVVSARREWLTHVDEVDAATAAALARRRLVRRRSSLDESDDEDSERSD